MNPRATTSQVAQLVKEAAKLEVPWVCLNPSVIWVLSTLAAEDLQVSVVVGGLGHGATFADVKALEARKAIGLGATEVLLYPNLGAIREEDWEPVETEIKRIKTACHYRGQTTPLYLIIDQTHLVPSQEPALVNLCRTHELSGVVIYDSMVRRDPMLSAVHEARQAGVEVLAWPAYLTLSEVPKFLEAGAARAFIDLDPDR